MERPIPVPGHARLQPSSASRVVQCAGSLTMCEQYPELEVNPKSVEGTLAHEVNVLALAGKEIPLEATDEMMDGAELWCDLLKPFGDRVHVEEKVDCSWVHPENWGTPDAWVFNRGSMELYIWDYKFGHRYVEVYENWQLINYVAGILDQEGITGLTDQMLTVHMTIVQPRHYGAEGPVRTWTVKGSDLRGHFNKLKAAWAEALQPDAPTKTGDECRDCKARHACPTLQRASFNAVDLTGINVPFNLDADALSLELTTMKQAAALLDYRIDGLESEVLGRIKQGTNVPGWMTQQSEGREKWNKPIEEVLALGDLMGVNISKPTALTPKQSIKAGLPAELIASYIERPKGEIKLVADDGTKARKIFGDIK